MVRGSEEVRYCFSSSGVEGVTVLPALPPVVPEAKPGGEPETEAASESGVAASANARKVVLCILDDEEEARGGTYKTEVTYLAPKTTLSIQPVPCRPNMLGPADWLRKWPWVGRRMVTDGRFTMPLAASRRHIQSVSRRQQISLRKSSLKLHQGIGPAFRHSRSHLRRRGSIQKNSGT